MTILADFGWTVLEILARLFHVTVFVGEKCVYTAYHMYRATALFIWPILRPTAAMVSHVFIWTDSTVCYGVVTFCCCILVVTTAVVIYRKTLTGVANHGMVAMVQLVNQWLASIRGRLQARGAQFGQHVTVGGTQTVQRDEVEAPRVQHVLESRLPCKQTMETSGVLFATQTRKIGCEAVQSCMSQL